MGVEELRDLFEGIEVVVDLLANAGPLDLDRHLPPVVHDGTMDLSQRGRGEGLVVELGEGLGQPDPQLLPDRGLDLLEREWGHIVLEAGEGVEVFLR